MARTVRALALSLMLGSVAAAGCGTTLDNLAWHSSRGAIHGGFDTLTDPNDRVHQALANPDSPVRQDLRRFLRESIADALDGVDTEQLQQRTEKLLQAVALVARRDGGPALAGLISDARVPAAALVDAIVADVVAAIRAQLRDLRWHDLEAPVHAVADIVSNELHRQTATALDDAEHGFETRRPELRRIARETTEEVLAGVGEALKNDKQIEPVVAAVGRQIAAGLGDDLREALARREAVWREVGIIASALFVLLAVAAAWLLRRHHRLGKALTIVAENINRHSQAGELKSRIQRAARENEVQSELSDFLKSRGL